MWNRHRTRDNAWSYTTTDKGCYTISGRNFDNFYRDCALMSAVVNTNKNDEPRNFQEAWYHQDSEKRQNWRVAIRKEFKDMTR